MWVIEIYNDNIIGKVVKELGVFIKDMLWLFWILMKNFVFLFILLVGIFEGFFMFGMVIFLLKFI